MPNLSGGGPRGKSKIKTQSSLSRYNLYDFFFITVNEDLGDLHFKAIVGNLPLKYNSLSEVDKKATEKAGDFIDFLPLVPYIDPLKIPVIPPFTFNIPFLFLK